MKASNEKQIKANIEALGNALDGVSEVKEESMYTIDRKASLRRQTYGDGKNSFFKTTKRQRELLFLEQIARAQLRLEDAFHSLDGVEGVVRELVGKIKHCEPSFGEYLHVFDSLLEKFNAKWKTSGLSGDKQRELFSVVRSRCLLDRACRMIFEAYETLYKNEMRVQRLADSELDLGDLDSLSDLKTTAAKLQTLADLAEANRAKE